jgi:filamentous hemagglutinin
MAALLGVSLFLIGCETEVEVPVPGKSDVIHVDEFVSNLSLLQGALNNSGNKTVALRGSLTGSLTAKLEVPANKALVLHAALPAQTVGVEISGTVYVEVDGSLTAGSTTLVSVLAGGVLNVSEKGTLVVDAATSVNDGTGSTVLGPGGKVNIAGRLNWGGTLTAIADLDAPLSYVGDGGVLVVTTAAASITPTEVVTKANANSGKFIVVEANGADATGGTFSVPANARITTSAVLGSAASITVYGGLTTSGATTGLAAGVAVTVKEGGSASLGGAIALLDSSVEEDGDLTLGGTVSFAAATDEIAVVAGSTVNGVTFPAATDITAVTSANALTIGNLTVPSGEVFEVPTGAALTVDTGAALTAGKIILGPGTWLATDAAVTIEEDKITLGSHTTAKFGADNGTVATVLTGTANATNTFTASGGTVTLGQSSNKLTVTGSAAAATLATGATAGINVKAGLDITTATVDISVATTSIIVLVDGDAAGITLANTDSVILLDSSSTAATNTQGITNLTIGGSVTVKAAATGATQNVGSFTGAATANTIVEDATGANVSIMKGLQTKA